SVSRALGVGLGTRLTAAVGDRGVQLEESLLELGVERIAGEGQAIPGMGLGEPSQGPAGVAQPAENLRIVTLGKGAGVLDEPFEAVAVSGSPEIRLGGLGLAGQAEGLAEAEERVAVVWVRGQRRAIRADGGAIALGQCQAAAETGQRGMIG